MENTEELEIDIDDIGAILKSNRLKQKKSLEDVSAELCIRKIYLTAIEDGDYETLPPVPYGIGYVRTYANYLGLSSERAVKLYKKASIIDVESKAEEVSLEPEVNKGNNGHVFIGIIALLVVYASWVMYSKLSNKQLTPNEEAVVAVVEVEEQEGVQSENINTDEVVQQVDTVNETMQPVDVNVAEDVAKIKKEIDEPEAIVDTKVKIKFNGESWVELKDKNKVYFQGVFHQGDIKEVEYTGNLFISVGRPKNVEVFVKGVKKDLLAKRRKTNIPVDSLE